MLRIKESGFFTTVQDGGRFGYRDMGVPLAGVMDQQAYALANSLLENKAGEAVLEITMTGPKLEFEAPTVIAITGAEMSASLNGSPIQNNEVHSVRAGDQLSFGKLRAGFRSYLALKGGLKTETVLNSRSFCKNITRADRIVDGDELAYETITGFQPKVSGLRLQSPAKTKRLEVFPGPEFDLLDQEQQQQLLNSNFTVAKDYNRMAYQLEEALPPLKVSMITSATLPGTVQVTPSGKILILMRDGQTTGGYPRILQLSSQSISVLAQKKFGDKLSFLLNRNI